MYRFAKHFGLLIAIIALCLGVQALDDFVADRSYPSALRLPFARALGLLPFYPQIFQTGDTVFPGQRLTMLISHGFAHVGWLHVWVNMAMLAVLGALVIRRVGTLRFALLYFGCMALAAVVYGMITAPEKTLLGASGGIHGLGGALFVLLWLEGRPQVRPWVRALGLLAALLAINAWFWWLTNGHFAWTLHLAGFAAGMALALLLRPAPKHRPPEQQNAAPKDGVS
ncbi:rhomboid family intramembrane serine protease [Pseudorhodobacter sp. E13]|uniref:rhomboid family intramembrane serine protease n=1 Tax=Pseudorhodobacter sp. E13 TaxID=2487931 RepID=UPI000F8E641F|nr:rhomboid family intramembrane serine protease [Pseudorhodobacter sp. E13]RUS59900.1 rhomboid family intramembrane serine protease [Pseudorhodobacter sp. E13]